MGPFVGAAGTDAQRWSRSLALSERSELASGDRQQRWDPRCPFVGEVRASELAAVGTAPALATARIFQFFCTCAHLPGIMTRGSLITRRLARTRAQGEIS